MDFFPKGARVTVEGRLVIPMVQLTFSQKDRFARIEDEHEKVILTFKLPKEQVDELLEHNTHLDTRMRVKVSYQRTFFGGLSNVSLEIIEPGWIKTSK